MDFQCPSCQAHLAVKATDAGKPMRCPYCMKEITIPHTSTAAAGQQEPGTGLIRLPSSELTRLPSSELMLVSPPPHSVSQHQLDMYAAPSVLHHPFGFFFVTIAAAGMLVSAILIWGVNDTPSTEVKFTSSRAAVTEESQAWAIARRAVRERVAKSDSAVFTGVAGDSQAPNEYARPDADGWIVSGWVKWTDDSGKTVHKHWIVTIDGYGQVTRCDTLE